MKKSFCFFAFYIFFAPTLLAMKCDAVIADLEKAAGSNVLDYAKMTDADIALAARKSAYSQLKLPEPPFKPNGKIDDTSPLYDKWLADIDKLGESPSTAFHKVKTRADSEEFLLKMRREKALAPPPPVAATPPPPAPATPTPPPPAEVPAPKTPKPEVAATPETPPPATIPAPQAPGPTFKKSEFRGSAIVSGKTARQIGDDMLAARVESRNVGRQAIQHLEATRRAGERGRDIVNQVDDYIDDLIVRAKEQIERFKAMKTGDYSEAEEAIRRIEAAQRKGNHANPKAVIDNLVQYAQDGRLP